MLIKTLAQVSNWFYVAFFVFVFFIFLVVFFILFFLFTCLLNFTDVSVIGVGGIKCMLGIGGCFALGWDGGSVFLDGMLPLLL